MKIKKEDIVIGGYYGFGSIGDEAILDSILESISLSGFSGKVFVINRKKGKRGSIIKIPRLSLFRLIYTFIRSRIFIFGGGSLLQDATSKRSLFYYEALLLFAKLLGCKTYIFANGIGPLSQRRILKRLVSYSACVSVRDPDSYEILKGLCAGVEISLRADPVFNRCGDEYKRRPLTCLAALEGKRYFAVSLRSCKKKGDIDLDALSSLIKKLRSEGLTPLYVPMQREYDLDICKKARLITGGVIADACDMDDIMNILRGAEFSIGMRLHFIIASAIMGVPFLALSYDRKVRSAALYLGSYAAVDAYAFSEEELECSLKEVRRSDRRALLSQSRRLSDLAKEDTESLCSLIRCTIEEKEKKGERAEQVSG